MERVGGVRDRLGHGGRGRSPQTPSITLSAGTTSFAHMSRKRSTARSLAAATGTTSVSPLTTSKGPRRRYSSTAARPPRAGGEARVWSRGMLAHGRPAPSRRAGPPSISEARDRSWDRLPSRPVGGGAMRWAAHPSPLRTRLLSDAHALVQLRVVARRRLCAPVLLSHLRDVFAAVLAPRFGVVVVHAGSSSRFALE